MPQMAPLLWIPLFVFSALFFLMFTAFNYSITTPIKISHTLKATPTHKLTWKW